MNEARKDPPQAIADELASVEGASRETQRDALGETAVPPGARLPSRASVSQRRHVGALPVLCAVVVFLLLVAGGLVFLGKNQGEPPPNERQTKAAKDPKQSASIASLQAPVLKRVYLDDLTETSLKISPNTIFSRRGMWGRPGKALVPIELEGKQVEHSLVMVPDKRDGVAFVEYSVPKGAEQFATDAFVLRSYRPGVEVVFKVMGDDQVLWRSEKIDRDHAPVSCSVDLAGIDQLRLIVECPNYSAWGAWIEPRFVGTNLQSAMYLDDLPELRFDVKRDTAFGKHGTYGALGEDLIRVEYGGRMMAHSLVMHPEKAAYAEYAVPEGTKGLAAITTVITHSNMKGSVVFKVFGDEELLWESAPVDKNSAKPDESFDVELDGIKRLTLRVECTGDSTNAWAAWLVPRFIVEEN